jgi:uncharacterized peroxidase-related enzyme
VVSFAPGLFWARRDRRKPVRVARVTSPMKKDPWIEVVSEAAADGVVKKHYDAAVERAGKVFNIVKIMSPRPQQLEDSMAFYRTLMFAPSPLSRAEREMLAVVVSHANRCHY